MFCPSCGNQLETPVKFCPHCGFDFTGVSAQNLGISQLAAQPQAPQRQAPQPQAYYPEQPQRYYAPQETYAEPEEERRPFTVVGIVGFSLSIVFAIAFNFYGLSGLVALLLSIIGLVQVANHRYRGKAFCIIGIILGALDFIYGVIYFLAEAGYL